ncbi:MAG: hypothetical protein WDO17_22385 [Alphaproteobacteria bacterium]
MSSLGLASVLLLAFGASTVFFLDWQKHRRTLLLRKVEALPERDRLTALEVERGVPSHGQSPTQYLASQIQRREIIQIALSAILLFASLFVILSKLYEPGDKHWAYGIIGTIIGFWLKPPSK